MLTVIRTILISAFLFISTNFCFAFFPPSDTLCGEIFILSEDENDTLEIVNISQQSDIEELYLPDRGCIHFKFGKNFMRAPFGIGKQNEKNKTTAILLTIFTGLVGGHRLYLETKPIVPVVYAVTLGGGFGIIPFIDLIVILVSDDMSRWENNDKILMWGE